MLRVPTLVPYLPGTAPSQRYRLEQWAPRLRGEGIELDLLPFEDAALSPILRAPGRTGAKMVGVVRGLARRARLLASLPGARLAIVHREAAFVGPALFERGLHARGIPFVYDFDDAIWLAATSDANRLWTFARFAGKTRTLCRLAAHVTAGNPTLAAWAQALNPAVSVVPSTIDTDLYAPRPSARAEIPVIGWSGSVTTAAHLDTVRPALRELRTRLAFRLRVIGVPGYRAEGLDVEAVPWMAATEAADLQPLDVGIMPLPDDPWTRGKCGLKALQYMALAKATVCSPVGVNTEIIQPGENGVLASTPAEWVEALESLLRSPDLRARLGAAARRTVEERYSAAVQAPRFAAILRAAAGV